MQVCDAFRCPFRFAFTCLAFLYILIVSCYLQDTCAHAGFLHSSNFLRPASVYHAIGKIQDTLYKCQSNTAPNKCYGVQQVRNAYSVTPLLEKGITGNGSSIVIVDAYHAPHLRDDLAVFDKHFDLPNALLSIVAPNGIPAWNPSNKAQVNWSSEISLDVEWAHAIAPNASITLVEARSEDDHDLFNALNYAVEKNLGDVISMSFGEAENCVKPELVKPWHKALHVAFQKRSQCLPLLEIVGLPNSAVMETRGKMLSLRQLVILW